MTPIMQAQQPVVPQVSVAPSDQPAIPEAQNVNPEATVGQAYSTRITVPGHSFTSKRKVLLMSPFLGEVDAEKLKQDDDRLINDIEVTSSQPGGPNDTLVIRSNGSIPESFSGLPVVYDFPIIIQDDDKTIAKTHLNIRSQYRTVQQQLAQPVTNASPVPIAV